MTGYHTRWVRPPDQAEDPERIAIREALAFGKAVYDQRRALDLSTAELAGRAEMTVDEIECIEEGGTEPTISLLRRLAAALDADVRLTAGHDLGSVWFDPTQPDPTRLIWAVSGENANHHTLQHTVGSRHSISRYDRQPGR
jgi:transcriptional regulator with XRE-family HTH domain